MRRLLGLVLGLAILGVAIGAGAALVFRFAGPRRPPVPDPPAVATRIRDVARLVALDVALYKKVSFAPEPAPAGSLWGDVAGWLRHTFRTPQGKAIVFADAHLGLDLSKLDASRIRVEGREIWVALPPIQVSVELRPGETEAIGSNLDTAETAQLFALAKEAFEREVAADRNLREKASAAAERAIRGLLIEAGFEQVHFVEALPSVPGA
jgi:hypothetical protein